MHEQNAQNNTSVVYIALSSGSGGEGGGQLYLLAETIATCYRESYVGEEKGKDVYIEAFCLEEWTALSERLKQRHTALSCLECTNTAAFVLKIDNHAFFLKVRENHLNADKLREQNTKRTSFGLKKSQTNYHEQTKTLVGELKECLKASQTSTDKAAAVENILMAASKSNRPVIKHNRRQQKSRPRKPKPLNLDLFEYNKEVILKALDAVADKQKHLGDKMNKRWSALANRANLRSKNNVSINFTRVRAKELLLLKVKCCFTEQKQI